MGVDSRIDDKYLSNVFQRRGDDRYAKEEVDGRAAFLALSAGILLDRVARRINRSQTY